MSTESINETLKKLPDMARLTAAVRCADRQMRAASAAIADLQRRCAALVEAAAPPAEPEN